MRFARASACRSVKRFRRCFRNIWIASIAADQQEVESFFGNFVPRSRVKEAINALQAARELDFIRVGNRSLIQLAQPKAPVVPRVRPGTSSSARSGETVDTKEPGHGFTPIFTDQIRAKKNPCDP